MVRWRRLPPAGVYSERDQDEEVELLQSAIGTRAGETRHAVGIEERLVPRRAVRDSGKHPDASEVMAPFTPGSPSDTRRRVVGAGL